ncbi:MAG TPA: efflux RND transporter periplasmic adaptor subunit [Polyangia bacterium]|nr:efflux RND transporter periplasmic adaptor subunit [Polyangia bacterium]
MPPLFAVRRRVRLFVLSLVSIAGAAGCASPAPPPGGPPPPTPVGVSTVEIREISPSDELTGRVEAIHNVEVRPRVSGYVTEVNFREGTDVARGATLFTIDARPYQAALARATAELAGAQARADLARAQSTRAELLFGKGAMNRADRDIAVSTAAQATAAVGAAAAAVDLARLDVEFTHVRAPLAGRSGQALVSIGDYVAAGPSPTLLSTVVSADPVYVYFTGDEQTFLRYASHAQDAPVAIGLDDEPGYPHAGKIDFVDNRVDAATGTIRLRAVVPNPDRRLTPGLFARVRLGEGKPIKAVAIDDKAILTDQDRRYVYLLGPAGTVERRNVKLGRLVDGLRVIPEGLQAGDRLIVSGIQKVFPGGKAVAAPISASAESGRGAAL